MNNQHVTDPQRREKNRSRYNLYVFAVCLLIATSVWLLIKITADYTVNVRLNINYIGAPPDRFISKADTSVTVSLRVNGTNLLFKKFKKIEQININISNVTFRKNEKNHYVGSLVLKPLIDDFISKKYPDAVEIVGITPEQIQIRLDYAYSKKIPVIVPLKLTFDKQHFQYGEMKISPDSISVYGTREVVSRYNVALSDTLVLENVNASVDVFVPLNLTNDLGFHASTANVKLQIPVEKFTEKRADVPVVFPVAKNGQNIKAFPENVTVTFQVALKDYETVNPALFRVVADTSGINKKTTLPLKVEQQPPLIRITKITPDEVEFIKIR